MTDQNRPTLWQQQLLQHAGNSPEIAVSLCDGFLQEVPGLLSSVNQMIRSQQSSDLFRPLHTLKSCLGYVASPKDLKLAQEVETCAKEVKVQDWDDFNARFQQLEVIAQQWVSDVRDFRQHLIDTSSGL